MKEFSNKLKSQREKLNLSIAQVSEKTKIRPHIIEAIEAANYEHLSPVYMKSFVKTYAQFLKVPTKDLFFEKKEQVQTYGDAEIKIEKKDEQKKLEKSLDIKESFYKKLESVRPKKKAEVSFDDVDKVQQSDGIKKPVTDYAAMFKKAKKEKLNRTQIINYTGAGALLIAVAIIVYFSFFSSEPKLSKTLYLEESNSNHDTTFIDIEEEDKLIDAMQEPDSLILVAKAIDEAWIKIDIDGKHKKETLMKANTEIRWAAKEFISITQGNVGAVQYKRNGKLLEPFGSRGSVVQNIKVTKNQILFASAHEQDSIKRRLKARRSRKKSNVPILIQPTNIIKTKENPFDKSK